MCLWCCNLAFSLDPEREGASYELEMVHTKQRVSSYHTDNPPQRQVTHLTHLMTPPFDHISLFHSS